jgi:hypothetical protein
MALRIPLVLSGIAVTELKPGDSLSAAPKFIPVVTRTGYISSVSLVNGPFIPVIKRDNSVINITLSV